MEIAKKDIKCLVRKAKEAKDKSYSPYSNFRVGAAVYTADRKIFTGCNVENVSYVHAVCAEVCALAKANSQGYPNIIAIAIARFVYDQFVQGAYRLIATYTFLTEPDIMFFRRIKILSFN